MSTIKPEIREKILMEIVETERDYVEDLRIIMEAYKTPLKESGIITEEQQKSLFANIDDIENLNRTKILSILLFRFDVAQRGGDSAWMMKINLGDVFTSLSEHLKQYTEYCANQPKALAMLRDLEKENAEFAKFTKDLMDNDPNVRGLSLLSFIIKPVQRLCKYPLLLRELINNTDPTLAEFKQLQEAAKKVNSTVDYVNEMQRKAELEEEEKTTEMSKIENSIEGGEILDLAADKNRKITRIGDIQRLVKKQKKERQPRKLYLFNNLVLLVKPKKKQGKKGKESKLDWFCKIADVSFIDLADNEASHISNGFELKNKKKPEEIVILCCENLDVKRAWMKDIKTHFKDHQKMEATRIKFTKTPRLNQSLGLERKQSRFVMPIAIQKRKQDPPADDGNEDWKHLQEQALNEFEPPDFVFPKSKFQNWLEYEDNVFQIPYYYNIETKESVWVKPAEWTQ